MKRKLLSIILSLATTLAATPLLAHGGSEPHAHLSAGLWLGLSGILAGLALFIGLLFVFRHRTRNQAAAKLIRSGSKQNSRR